MRIVCDECSASLQTSDVSPLDGGAILLTINADLVSFSVPLQICEVSEEVTAAGYVPSTLAHACGWGCHMLPVLAQSLCGPRCHDLLTTFVSLQSPVERAPDVCGALNCNCMNIRYAITCC